MLDVSGTSLGDRGVAVLAASPHLACIHALGLSNNGVGHLGARALAQGIVSPVGLDLSENPIDDAGALELAAAPRVDRMMVLTLSGKPIAREVRQALTPRAATTSTRVIF